MQWVFRLAFLATLTLLCAGVALASAIVSGVVTEAGGGTLANVTIDFGAAGTTITAVDGSYAMTLDAGTYTIRAYDDNHYAKSYPDVVVADGANVVRDFALVAIPAPSDHVEDTYSRTDLGTTEDLNAYIYGTAGVNAAAGQEAYIDTMYGELYLKSPDGTGDCQVAIGANESGKQFKPADFDMTVTMYRISGQITGWVYRNSQISKPGYGNNGYGLFIHPDGGVRIYHNGANYWGSKLATWDLYHTFRIRAISNHHQVWLDGELIIDLWDTTPTSNNAPGYMYTYVENAEAIFDNLSIDVFEPPTGTVSGVVSDQDNPSLKIAGATVKVDGYSTTTDSNGAYSLTVPANGTYQATASAERYYDAVVDNVQPAPEQITTVNFVIKKQPYAESPDAADTFTRDDSADLGTTEDATHWTWIKSREDANIAGHEVVMPTGGNVAIGTNSGGSPFSPTDFDLTLKVRNSGGGNWGVGWRQAAYTGAGYANGGYMLLGFSSGATSVYSAAAGHRWGGNYVPDTNIFHTVRIKVIGDHHIVWIDGNVVNDFVETLSGAARGGGYIYVTSSEASGPEIRFDDVQCYDLTSSTGVLQGTITDASSPGTPVAGATVILSNNATVTTDWNGQYMFTRLGTGSYDITASKGDAYFPRTVHNVAVTDGATSTRDFEIAPRSLSYQVVDHFSEPDGPDLGLTEDAGAFNWYKTMPTSGIVGGMLNMPGGGNCGPDVSTVTGKAFRPTDFDLTTTVQVDWQPGPSNGAIGVCYRQNRNADPGYGNGGYLAFIFGNGSVTLYTAWTGHVGQTAISPAPDWSIPHNLRVKAFGNHHEAWFDGQKIIDYLDFSPNAKNSGGYLYLTPSSPGGFPMRWDDFVCDVYDPPAVLVSGTVTSASDPNVKIAGATVFVGNAVTTTDANGLYSVDVGMSSIGEPVSVWARASGYLDSTPTTVTPIFGNNVSADIALSPIPVAAVPDVLDTFGRADSTDLGVTEDDKHWTWFKSKDDIQISGGQLVFPTGGCAGPDQKSDGTLFRPADFELEGKFVSTASGGYCVVGYRNDGFGGAPYANGGYSVWVRSDGAAYLYTTWLGPVGGTNIAPAPDLSVPHAVKVRAFGNHHEMWFDGQKVVDYYDTSAGTRNSGGYIYLTDGIASNAATWDDLKIAVGALLPGPAVPVASVAEAKSQADGTAVSLSDAEVTRAFDGFFYIEDAGRASGIRVVSGASVAPGSKASVVGVLATEGGERKLVASSVTASAGTPTIRPLGIGNAAIDPNLGASTVGLLVKTWGRVTQTPAQDWGYIPIDDGRGGELRIQLGFDYSSYTYPAQDDYIAVVGVHGAISGQVVHVGDATDIAKVGP